MEITNKGYINFNDKYNDKKANYCTASMSFYNGKDEGGSYKSGYIGVIAFGELGDALFNSVGKLVTVSGYYRLKEYGDKKYPQVVITAIDNNQGNYGNQGSYNQQPQQQTPNFGRNNQMQGNPLDISSDDLPF